MVPLPEHLPELLLVNYFVGDTSNLSLVIHFTSERGKNGDLSMFIAYFCL